MKARTATAKHLPLWAAAVPGVLAEVNAYLAEQGANVSGQYLATRGEQGYVVTDATEAIGDAALDKLRSSDQTIWLRSYQA